MAYGISTSTLARLIDDPSGIRIRNSADAIEFLVAVGVSAARLLLPIVIVLALAGLASSFLQNVPRIVFEKIKPEAVAYFNHPGLGKNIWRPGPRRVREVCLQVSCH